MFLPTVSWSTIVKDVFFIEPNIYQVTVIPEDINEPGAANAEKEIGYYLKDFVGYTYIINQINIDFNPNRIEVIDLLGVGCGPQNEQFGYIYKSVGDGQAPYLAPVNHQRLDKSALDFSRKIELEIIWTKLQPRHEQLIGNVNGSNKIFQTSVPYVSGKISVFVNGIKEHYFTEISENQIELDEAPKNINFTDIIEAIFNIK